MIVNTEKLKHTKLHLEVQYVPESFTKWQAQLQVFSDGISLVPLPRCSCSRNSILLNGKKTSWWILSIGLLSLLIQDMMCHSI